MKKCLSILLAICMCASLAACTSSSNETTSGGQTDPGQTTTAAGTSGAGSEASSTDYPKKDINCIVPFGAGGGTDNLMRPLATIVQQSLGVSLIVDNVTGASGATGAVTVRDSAADGYTLLMTAENPSIYDAMDISDLTYDDFEIIFLLGSESVILYVAKDSPYNTVEELFEYALQNPGKVTKPVAGSAGLAAIADSLIKAAIGAELTQSPSDGDADALVQVMGGQVTCGIGKLSTVGEYLESGDIKALCSFTTERMEQLPDVPAITEDYPEFEAYLPWGSFYTVCAPKGTPQDLLDTLADAFKAAYEDPSYQELLTSAAIEPLGLTGDDTREYVSNYRKNVVTSLIEAGTIQHTLDELGIQ